MQERMEDRWMEKRWGGRRTMEEEKRGGKLLLTGAEV